MYATMRRDLDRFVNLLEASGAAGTAGTAGPAGTAGSDGPQSPEEVDEVPVEFRCPITHELLGDPVIAADGHT